MYSRYTFFSVANTFRETPNSSTQSIKLLLFEKSLQQGFFGNSNSFYRNIVSDYILSCGITGNLYRFFTNCLTCLQQIFILIINFITYWTDTFFCLVSQVLLLWYFASERGFSFILWQIRIIQLKLKIELNCGCY